MTSNSKAGGGALALCPPVSRAASESRTVILSVALRGLTSRGPSIRILSWVRNPAFKRHVLRDGRLDSMHHHDPDSFNLAQ